MKEIIIIETQNGERIKKLLNREQVSYQVIYDQIIYDKNLTEEEIWRRDVRLAAQDKERQKEIAEWDRIQAQDDAKLNQNDDDWDWN